jgi:pimeloyl-ACP methyl ester carboxylesterase
MPQTIYEYGGRGTVIHMAVANGFPPQTYAPIFEPLTDRYRALSLPPRALWADPPPLESFESWHDLAADLLAGLDQFDLSDVIAVGHSFGGIGSMIAAAESPAHFRGLILLDPTLLPTTALAGLAELRASTGRTPLSEGALKRKARFTDIEEAYAYWRGKPLFADWSDAAVRLYAESLTRPTPSGALELTWPPEWEAHYYDTITPDIWDYLPRLRGRLPTLIVRGTRSNTLTPEGMEQVRGLLPEADYAEVEGGHLFPHSAPDATRAVIEAWLAKANLD